MKHVMQVVDKSDYVCHPANSDALNNLLGCASKGMTDFIHRYFVTVVHCYYCEIRNVFFSQGRPSASLYPTKE